MDNLERLYENILIKEKKKFKMPKWAILKKRLMFWKKKRKKKVKKTKVAFDMKRAQKKSGGIFAKILKKMKISESREMGKAATLLTFLNDQGGKQYTDDDIEPGYSDGMFKVDGYEWLVLTDDEADETAKNYIEESVWAFNDWFIMNYINVQDMNEYFGFQGSYYDEDLEEDVDIDDEDEIFYIGMGMTVEEWVQDKQSQCEGGNDDLINVIDDFDKFIEDAISADGRGHFMSSYDGEEHEKGDYFIYRTN